MKSKVWVEGIEPPVSRKSQIYSLVPPIPTVTTPRYLYAKWKISESNRGLLRAKQMRCQLRQFPNKSLRPDRISGEQLERDYGSNPRLRASNEHRLPLNRVGTDRYTLVVGRTVSELSARIVVFSKLVGQDSNLHWNFSRGLTIRRFDHSATYQ